MTDIKNEIDDISSIIKELSTLIENYDLRDDDSSSNFAQESPRVKLKQALSEKLMRSTGKPLSECEIEAEELVNGIEKDITNPTSKTKICLVLKSLSADISNLSTSTISGAIAGLVLGGSLVAPFISALPTIGVAIASIYIVRIGIECICSDN